VQIAVSISSKRLSRVILKKSTRMMLRLPEKEAQITMHFSELETRKFQDQLLHYVRLGIKAAGHESVNGTEGKPGPESSAIVSKRKRA
jgi:hypothetical protein